MASAFGEAALIYSSFLLFLTRQSFFHMELKKKNMVLDIFYDGHKIFAV